MEQKHRTAQGKKKKANSSAKEKKLMSKLKITLQSTTKRNSPHMKRAYLIHQPPPEFGDCYETCKEPRKDKVTSQDCKI